MRKTLNPIKKLLDECSDQDRLEWNSHAQTILGAIHTSHPTRRGIQNAIAAAFFDSTAMQELQQAGWARKPAARPDRFRLVIENAGRSARILIATLKLDAGKPMKKSLRAAEGSWYVAHLPKKPRKATPSNKASPSRTRGLLPAGAYSTREFDVLAVNMYPVTRTWADFRYALSRSLLLRGDSPHLIASLQPVPAGRSDLWTSELVTCIKWHLDAETPDPS
jgi:hypothetical protein